MSSLVKYRIKEVAADFGMQAKDIAAIVEKYFEKPRSNNQVLEDEQLNVIFDCLTQTHQSESLEQVFAAASAKQDAQKAEEKKQAEHRPLLRPRPKKRRRSRSPRKRKSRSASGSAGWWTPPPSMSTPNALTTGWTA